jgi:hypothetical protein
MMNRDPGLPPDLRETCGFSFRGRRIRGGNEKKGRISLPKAGVAMRYKEPPQLP